MHPGSNKREIASYFEYSNHGIEVVGEGLQELPFGEYLVEQNAISRFELLRALQMQDQKPEVPIGECIAALGYMRWAEVKEYLGLWKHLEEVVV